MITATTIVLPDAAVDETSGAGLLSTATDSNVEFGAGSVVSDEVGARDVGLEVGSDVGDAVGGSDGEYVSCSSVG